jgi:hypothetical protein
VSTIRRAPRVRVGPALAGRGVFAGQSFDAEAVVGRMRGRYVDDPEYGSDYCIGLGEGLSLEPAAPFRFLNHSCEPNCAVFWSDEPRGEDEAPRVWIETLRAVEAGEELTIDYAWDSTIECRCGSQRCRGWITSGEE